MTTSTLLSLPDELLVKILSHLPPRDVLSAQLTSHHLNATVTNSVWLQYQTLLKAAEYSDNPSCSLGIRDRLSALKKQEKAWASLRPAFTHEIEVQHQPGGIYDITGGVYLLGDQARKSLFWVQLPTREEEEEVWRMIDMGSGLFVVDLGLCIYEHDLIGVVTTSPHPSVPATYTTKLHLLQFSASSSSCRPTSHPLAAHSPLHILDSLHEKPSIWLKIVGSHLILLLVFLRTPAERDRVLVYNWRSGQVVAQLRALNGSYHGVVPLTERYFILPNASKGRLEVYEIPIRTETHVDGTTGIDLMPIHVLAFPALAQGRTFVKITCRGEPNPIGEGCMKLHTTIPCYPSPEDAIIIFSLRVSGTWLASGHYAYSHALSMYVHRRALLEVCKRDSSAQAVVGRSGTNQALACDSISASAPQPIPYHAWGPPITRWFNIDEVPHGRITTTAGQRAVIISHFAFGTGAPYVVLDFNQGNVRRAKKALSYHNEENNPFGTEGGSGSPQTGEMMIGYEADDDSDDNEYNWDGSAYSRELNPEYPLPHRYTNCPNPNPPPNRWVITAFHAAQPPEIFDLSEPPVGGSLPCVACSSPKGYIWDGVLMDGERVVGIMSEPNSGVQRVQVDVFR